MPAGPLDTGLGFSILHRSRLLYKPIQPRMPNAQSQLPVVHLCTDGGDLSAAVIARAGGLGIYAAHSGNRGVKKSGLGTCGGGREGGRVDHQNTGGGMELLAAGSEPRHGGAVKKELAGGGWHRSPDRKYVRQGLMQIGWRAKNNKSGRRTAGKRKVDFALGEDGRPKVHKS